MANKETPPELEVNQDLNFQRRMWRIQRAGWAIMTILLLGGLFGLFGVGPLSEARALAADGTLRVDYSRFARFETSTKVTVYIDPAVTQQEEVRLWVKQDYLRPVQIERISPAPDREAVAEGGQVYVFKIEDPGQPAEIYLYLWPRNVGIYQGGLGLEGTDPVQFRQLVYP
jgi:hypothetical protein